MKQRISSGCHKLFVTQVCALDTCSAQAHTCALLTRPVAVLSAPLKNR